MKATINAEVLIKNFKLIHDLNDLKSTLYDVSLMAQEANPKEFLECGYREKLKEIYGLLDSIDQLK